ncbi:hypothetical protein NPIL_370901 [Nephila pilipes]|uniref:Uncharacterized protein n=1 Tax=Nephila pilipes TaxID=299642 RepID=A0A8X6U813_NEPPI|nr:hypothetical protein NPIL_370901 [Nephila pilipes]
MKWFEECEALEDDSDIGDAETIISDYEEESGQESEENSDLDSEEEEDDMVIMKLFLKESRLDFTKNPAKQLASEELERRLTNTRLRQEVRRIFLVKEREKYQQITSEK